MSNRRDLADYAAPAFALAKAAGKPPFEIATALANEIGDAGSALIAEATASPPGFLNLRIAEAALAEVVAVAHRFGGAIGDNNAGAGTKVVIEHTNVNPNKAAHVGHFRNACLGDTVARLLRRTGYDVEVQNYIDDTGVQVADVVVGLRYLSPIPASEPGERFDRFCSRVYAAVTDAYTSQPELLERRKEVQRSIEEGGSELADFARGVAEQVVGANLETMARAGVEYDLLTWESDILRLGFWEHAFGALRDTGAVRFEEDGPNQGTWVMPFGGGALETDGRTVNEDKVLVTREGIATYTAKDLAYQLWKFDLLDRDFRYRVWSQQPSGHTLWCTTSSAGDPGAPRFAHAERVINVIDVSQSYPQQIVYEGLRRLGHAEAAEASEHLAYGLVSLTAASARTMGLHVPDEDKTVAMKGRAGVQIFADELLDRLESLVKAKADGATASTAALATGAARYYMLKFSNQQDIAFDFEDALRTTGETGVYLQYAYVRAAGILRRLEATGPSPAPTPIPGFDRVLVLRMADYPRILATASAERSPSALAKYAFELAASFSTFYDNTDPVVNERDPDLKRWRAGLVSAFHLVLGDILDLLGIPRLERI